MCVCVLIQLMDKLSAVSDEVCERIIASKFHADVLDYLSSMDKPPDDWDDETVYHQMLFHVVSRTSAHDDLRQRRAVDIARKFPTLTNYKVTFYTYYSAVASPYVCLVIALSTPASYQ